MRRGLLLNLNKTFLFVILSSTAFISRQFDDFAGIFSADHAISSDQFEGRIVDGLSSQDCSMFNEYNLVLIPGLNTQQKTALSAHCSRLFSKNNTASLEDTEYNISKLKGFGAQSAKRLAEVLWGYYEKRA